MDDSLVGRDIDTVTALKLYGERNTGTNYLSHLIGRNFDVRQMRGVAEHSILTRLVTRIARRHARGLSVRLQNDSADRYFARNLDKTLGWKHCRVPVARIAEAVPTCTAIVCLVKNPYSWLASLHRNPYSDARPAQDFTSFMTSPYPTVGRELMGDAPMRPMEIWRAKVQSYLDLQAARPRVAVLRYEDFLADEGATLTDLATACGLPLPQAWTGFTRATKQGTKGQDEIRAYYLQKKWLERFDAAQLAQVNSDLDPALLQGLGYDLEINAAA